MAERVEDLKVWQRAVELSVAVNAICDKREFRRNLKLRGQLLDASTSVVANIAEGFEQPTDRAFARYLYISKSSNGEVRTRLVVACKQDIITKAELAESVSLSDEVARMLTGFIKYLLRSDRRRRGLGPNDENKRKRRKPRESPKKESND